MGNILSIEELELIKKSPDVSDDDFTQIVINSTPSLWVEGYLFDPDVKDKRLELRKYQKECINSKETFRSLRYGRGAGKTVAMSAFLLWDCMTENDVKIFVYIPGKSQLDRIYEVIEGMIENSPEIKESIEIQIKQKSALNKGDEIDHRINFKNGSTITFFITNTKIDKIRGHHNPKRVFIDESHYVSEEAHEAILGVINNMKTPWVWQSSTPRGKFGSFYEWTIKKEVWDQHVKSSDRDDWSEEKERAARTLATSDAVYNRENNAEFGDEEDTIYRESEIDNALIKTQRPYGRLIGTIGQKQYQSLDSVQMFNEYISKCKGLYIGVDWNTPSNGVQIVYLTYDKIINKNELAVVKVESISNENFTQTMATQRIIEINNQYNPNYIFADIGYGSTQIELITKYADDNPESKLKKRFRAIDFKQSIELDSLQLNPSTRKEEKIKISCKNFMVSLVSRHLKENELVLPFFEDTKMGLISDLRAFKLDKIGQNGEPIYSKKGGAGQHRHMALCLAVYANYIDNEKPIRKDLVQTVFNSISNNTIEKVFTTKKANYDSILMSESSFGNRTTRTSRSRMSGY